MINHQVWLITFFMGKSIIKKQFNLKALAKGRVMEEKLKAVELLASRNPRRKEKVQKLRIEGKILMTTTTLKIIKVYNLLKLGT